MKLPKILIVPGSIRSGSHNLRLSAAAYKVFSTLECEVTRLSLHDFPLPIYDHDLENQNGIPKDAVNLARMFNSHDGIMLVSPEYNGSLPPLLKNVIDWVSCVKSDERIALAPYKGKTFALVAAAPGRLGGVRCLSHLRDILTSVGASVIAEQAAVGNVGKIFDDMDELTDEGARDRLNVVCTSLVATSRLLSLR